MFTISGDNATCLGQITVAGAPTSPTHVVVNQDPRHQLRGTCQTLAINLNASAPVDLSPLVPLNAAGFAVAKYIPRRITLLNATGNASGATLGVYSGAGATGTTVVTPVALTNLTGSTKFIDLTIAALTDVLTAANLYPRLTVAAGSAMTCDIVMEFTDLSNS
jgi:hypothetical protein